MRTECSSNHECNRFFNDCDYFQPYICVHNNLPSNYCSFLHKLPVWLTGESREIFRCFNEKAWPENNAKEINK